MRPEERGSRTRLRARERARLAKTLVPRPPAVLCVVRGPAGVDGSNLVDEVVEAALAERPDRPLVTVTGLPWETGFPGALAVRLRDQLASYLRDLDGGFMLGGRSVVAETFTGGVFEKGSIVGGLFTDTEFADGRIDTPAGPERLEEWSVLLQALPPGTIVRVQDAQFADPVSLRALSSLVHRLTDSDLRVLVVSADQVADSASRLTGHSTTRVAWNTLRQLSAAHRNHAIDLSRLTARDVEDIARARRQTVLPGEAARIAAHTGGVSEDTRDVLDAIAEQGILSAGAPMPVTTSARAHVRHLLTSLTEFSEPAVPPEPATPTDASGDTASSGSASPGSGATPPAVLMAEALSCFPDGADADVVAATAGLLPAPTGPDTTPEGNRPTDGIALARHVDTLVELGLIAEDATAGRVRLRFVTPLMRQAVYSLLPLARRSELHRRAADVLTDEAERLLQLAAGTTSSDPDLAVALRRQVAEARSKGRWQVASDAAWAVISLVPHGPERDRSLVEALDAASAAGDMPRALLLAREVESLPATPITDATLAYAAMSTGNASQARFLQERAWQLASPARRPAEAALICHRRALHGLFDWDAASLVEWTERAAELTAPPPPGPGETAPHSVDEAAPHGRDGSALTGSNEPRFRAPDDSKRAPSTGPRSGTAPGTPRRSPTGTPREPRHEAQEAQAFLGLGLAALGRREEAFALYRELSTATGAQAQRIGLGLGWLELASDEWRRAAWRLGAAAPTRFHRGSQRIGLWAYGWLARAQLALGNWDAALLTVASGQQLAEHSGLDSVAPLLHWTGAEIHAMRGDLDLAAEHAALAAAGPGEYATSVIPAALARAHIARVRHEPNRVLEALAPLLELRATSPIDAPGFWPWQDLYADALVAVGELDTADEFLRPLETEAEATGHRSTVARLATSRARWHHASGNLDAAVASYLHARDAVRWMPLPYQRALTAFAHGTTLRHAGRRKEAAGVLREARELFADLGATPYTARSGRELTAATAARETDRPTDLTAQETAVANLVALGRRNREIAAELYISPKTVEYHLTRIYNKLNLRSRSELAAWMQQTDV